ncbi:hypothetical protein L1S32_04225 [Methanogenium sp. S4BF]|uniref:hypothetical protein n=1 Tax=Methanogenium sp. S4BF TaxID=1789226 RepID=UPI00241699A2|nr:hypothetical protein [Methanogenium sp. S4BF]WFN35335.1 hypothetical protein L1S32_04225 [Methanogenium sp. S4BF]
MADYLHDHLYDVYVVHSRNAEYWGDSGHKIRFHPIPIGSSNAAISSEDNAVPEGEHTGSELKNKMKGIAEYFVYKSNLISLEKGIFNEPNRGMGTGGYLFIRNAREHIFRTISEKGIRHVIISGPPFSLFCLVPQIKKRFPEVNVIIDYRDPWNTPYLSYAISSYIERNALKYADKVVFLNERMLSDVSSQFCLPGDKCEVVLNGYSKQNWDEVLEKYANHDTASGHQLTDRMIIGYVGGVSFDKGGYYDIPTFLKAFQIFQENKMVLLRFVGVNTSDAADVEKVKKQFPETLEVLPPVNNDISLKTMLECDVLFLNYADERRGRYMLTGKFFDYIRSGKVIFGVAGSEDTYFLELIRKHHLGIGCLSQSPQILECLELLYENWERGTLGELRDDRGLDLENLSRDAQNSRYLKLLEGL